MRIDHRTGEKSPAPFSKIKLLIGIPTRGTASIGFAESLAVTCCLLQSAGVDFEIFHHESSCFVCMSRNKLIAKMLQSDFTHIFMVDDDMEWNADAVLHMLSAKKDFIAGIGPLKTESGEDWACNLYSDSDGNTVIDGALMKAQYVGGAFVILSRDMLVKMTGAYPNLASKAVDPDQGYSFFESQYHPRWQTEDYVFCDRWRDIGGEIWAYPDITFVHQGLKGYKGNYLDYRVNLAKADERKSESSQMIEDVISGMHLLAARLKPKALENGNG